MQKIVFFTKQKGGVGSSTLALSTYFCLKSFSKDLTICLVDLDPQASLLSQKNRNKEIEVFARFDETKLKDFDVVIIDGPPRITKEFEQLYSKANLLIIPTKTGFYDATEVLKMFQYLKNKGLENKTFAVLNQAAPTSSLNRQFLDTLDTNEIPYLNTIIYNRLGFHRCQYEGGNIFDLKGQRKAQDEVKALTMEIYSLLIK